MPGVRVLDTPGHTAHHASLVVTSRVAGRTARAGDALLSYAYFLPGSTWTGNADFHDRALALESMQRIAHAADIIVPGHGAPSASFRSTWMEGGN